jgi:OmpA-OmpF porin, OOP family
MAASEQPAHDDARGEDDDDLRGFVGWLVLILLGALFTILAFLLLRSVDPGDEPAPTTVAVTTTTTEAPDPDEALLELVRDEIAALYASGEEFLDSDSSSFGISVEDGVVSIDGQVSSEAERDRVLALVQGLDGVAPNIDHWLEAPVPDPAEINAAIKEQLLALYAEYGIEGEPELVDGTWFLRGVAPDADAKSGIAGPARKVEGVSRTRNVLLASGEVGTQWTPLSTVLTVTSGQVSLRGVVPSEEARAAVVAAAQAVFGAGNVTDNLEVDPDAEGRVVMLGGVAEGAAAQLDSMEAALAAAGFSLDVQSDVVELTEEQSALQADLDAAVADVIINFASGSSFLTSAEAANLAPVIEILAGAEDILVAVEGHTDDRGDAASNQLLSQDRAQAVVDYLISQGIDETLLRAAGNGQSQPVGDNATPEGRAQNRRTEFRVVV